MKPMKKTTKYMLIAIIILILAAFGLIDFRGLFKSEPQTATDPPAVEIKKPETFVSEQKFDQAKDKEDPKDDNAIVPAPGPTDAITPPDSHPEKIKPPTQKDMAQADLESDNSVIQTPTEKQKPAISETDITAKDDATLAKPVDSTPSNAADDTPGKPKASDADSTTNQPEAPPADLSAQNADIFIIGEGPGPYPYSIQLASFNEDNHAVFKKSLQQFQNKGLSPFWVKVDLGGKGFWHRVLAGCFRQKSEAREVIRAKNLEGVIVADTKFAVIIGEYKDEKALRKMITSLETKGYFPYVIKKAAAKYVLYVGAFYTRKVAQRTVDELTVQGMPSETVLR